MRRTERRNCGTYGREQGHGKRRSHRHRHRHTCRAARAGDHVLTVDAFGELTTPRLIVNQHVKPNGVMAELLTIKHANGTLELTPDHVRLCVLYCIYSLQDCPYRA